MARKPKAETITLELLTTKHDGKTYVAGGCIVTIGNIPQDAIAVRAGDEKRVTTEEHAVPWLLAHGLPETIAYRLVEAALDAFRPESKWERAADNLALAADIFRMVAEGVQQSRLTPALLRRAHQLLKRSIKLKNDMARFHRSWQL